MLDIQQLQTDIKKWSDGQFGMHRTGLPIAYHLKKETDELIDAIDDINRGTYTNSGNGPELLAKKRDRLGYELADCFILLLDTAAHMGIHMESLMEYSEKKLEICKTRVWGAPDENGAIEHIKQPEHASKERII